MRVKLQHDDESAEHFAKQLLDIGNGKMAIDESTKCITLPTNFCNVTSTRDELIQKAFPNIVQHFKNHQWLSERAILAAKNNNVNAIKFSIQNEIPGETTTYKSIDTVMNQDEVISYPIEILNTLDLPDLLLSYCTITLQCLFCRVVNLFL
jgi:ATP-dependent DNA helicase PIF1